MVRAGHPVTRIDLDCSGKLQWDNKLFPTYLALKTITVFLEDDYYTFYEKYEDLEINIPSKDIIYNNYDDCLQLFIPNDDSVIVYEVDYFSSYLIHGLKPF